MNTFVRYLALIVALLSFFVLSSLPATAALVRYTYTGNTFTDVFPLGVGDIGVNISFVVEETLLPKSGRAILDVDDYTSGRIPFTFIFGLGKYYKIDTTEFYTAPNNNGVDPHFSTYYERSARIEFDTDADGHLTGNWNAALNRHEYGRPGLLGGVSISSVGNGVSSLDAGELMYSFTGSVTGNPGNWTRELASVPVPASGFLFGFVIFGLVSVRLRGNR
ncbi:hypothetical protein [Methylomonas koyamae]|uniref:hypothetical protein n=1 Tax=Methylomonas koyamae TaxID=702114 RepID=UPI001125F128|nr:hypothetical protein [Methylomonas koyamae]